MPSQPDTSVAAVGLDHVELYVADAEKYAEALVDQWAFRVAARSPEDRAASSVSIALRHGEILIVLTQPLHDSHPAATYLRRHGDGVANIALRTSDAAACLADALARGARMVPGPAAGGVPVARVQGFGDTHHTIVERSGADDWCPPGLVPVAPAPTGDELGLLRVDHFAVCAEAGQLDACVTYYETAFGFREIFEEHVVVGEQAMNSKVVQSPSKEITLTILEPDTNHKPGQINDFVNQHGGAGVQHVAFSSSNVLRSVGGLRDRGVEFLSSPGAYYDLLSRRMDVVGYDVDALRHLGILVDRDHAGQLFQIFTRSQHPRRTLFFEVIERHGAQTFGSGNIRALYEAVEQERIRLDDEE
ncbi:4-hydroxyphenylpyruvate dioxygenase [Plantactinospora sp. WMMB334]|uniref:4-hydroxyphenylpyruvate dioxygenase n=1 Tax=Plantactinospora sp. WMMB334 TaxID=3404119 RepID=UPI003B94263A